MVAEAAEVAYVVSRWGEPTQTFVRREAQALAQRGVSVTAFSIKTPRAADGVRPLHLSHRQVLVGVLRALVRRPRRFVKVVSTVVRHASLRTLVPHLAAALTGLGWSGAGVVRAERLHVHFGWISATAGWAASTYLDLPFSVTLHAFELHRPDRVDGFAPVPLEAAQKVFVVTRSDVELVRERWGLDASLIKMGVPASWCSSAPTERDEWLVCSVGSLVPKKGHDILLRALRASDPRWKLVICGEGPERSKLEALVSELGLHGRVELAGHVAEHDVSRCLSRSAVFCLASTEAANGDRDGVPVALMEAMARRTPVLSTCVGGIPDLVSGAGVLVPQNDPHHLARALDSLRDPARRVDLGDRGASRIETGGYTADDAVEPLFALVRAGSSGD